MQFLRTNHFGSVSTYRLIVVIIVLFLKSFLLQGQNGLETINSFPGHWCCINADYLYGTADSKRYVYRKSVNGQGTERRGSVTSLNSSFEIQNRIYSTSVTGLIFVLVKDSSNVHYLLRSSDGGSTMTSVFTFGENNGANGWHAPSIRLLRGFLELTRDLPSGTGKGTLILGEYNIGSARVAGGVNDRVRIMKSDDRGVTWSKAVEWNTNGNNQVGHIHAIKQDPYTGYIYICTGDNNNKAGIIRWDGVSQWQDNATLTEINDLPGFDVLTGSQRHRVCDILFEENYFYTFTDTQLPNNRSGSESGIWRGRKDFSSFTRVNNEIFDYDPMHVGWFGEKIGDTFIFTTAREYSDPQNAWRELNTHVYTSIDGVTWKKSGQINWRDTGNETTTSYITNLFTYENRLYIDCMGGAGHYSTIVCELAEHTPYTEPVILHPVFFVGNWNNPGNDANTGTNADAPKRTLNRMVTDNRISAGSRVRISEGHFYEPAMSPQWSGAFIQGRGSVIIEGKGIDQTHLIWTGNSNTYGIYADAARTMTSSSVPLIFKDIEMHMSSSSNTNHFNNIFRLFGSYVKTISCRVGNSDNDESPLISLETEGSKYVSENSVHLTSVHPGGRTDIVEVLSAYTQLNFINSVIINPWIAFRVDHPGVTISLKNCTFYNVGNTALNTGSSFNTQPTIKNCIFICGQNAIEDRSGQTENDIDYNFYSKGTINVTDGGHSITSDSDPLFADPANLNFDLLEGSPCIMKGILLSDISYDIGFKARRDPPSIGAFESYASSHSGEIPTTSESTTLPEISIYPNPAADVVFVNYRDKDFKTLQILNSTGIVFFRDIAIKPLQQIDISSLKPGLYFLELSNGRISQKFRIIKK